MFRQTELITNSENIGRRSAGASHLGQNMTHAFGFFVGDASPTVIAFVVNRKSLFC